VQHLTERLLDAELGKDARTPVVVLPPPKVVPVFPSPLPSPVLGHARATHSISAACLLVHVRIRSLFVLCAYVSVCSMRSLFVLCALCSYVPIQALDWKEEERLLHMIGCALSKEFDSAERLISRVGGRDSGLVEFSKCVDFCRQDNVLVSSLSRPQVQQLCKKAGGDDSGLVSAKRLSELMHQHPNPPPRVCES
jgi:hypothetical protein